MPKKRFNDEQIAFALRQAEAGTTVGEICRKIGTMEIRRRCRMGNLEMGRLVQQPSPARTHWIHHAN